MQFQLVATANVPPKIESGAVTDERAQRIRTMRVRSRPRKSSADNRHRDADYQRLVPIAAKRNSAETILRVILPK